MNDTALFNDGKLDTGMKATEAIKRAEHWWDNKGRQLMRREVQKGNHNLTSVDPDHPNFWQSAIVNGLAWAALNKREKLHIVKVWHHFAVRRPDQLGVAPDDDFVLDGTETVN